MGKFNVYCSNSRVSVWVEWWETDVNEANNTSVLHAQVYLQRQNNGYTTYGTADTSITIDGITQSGSKQFSNTGASATLLLEKSATVTHSEDGSKTAMISVSVGGTNSPITASGSGQATLTTIARKSTVSLSTGSCDMGEQISIYNHSASSSFKHSAYFVVNGTDHTIASNVQASKIDWNTGDLFALCQSKKADVTIKLETYRGSTLIGTDTAALTVYVPQSSRPVFTSVSYTQIIEAVSELLGNTSDVIQSKSVLEVTFTGVQAKDGATVERCYVRYNGMTFRGSESSVLVYGIVDVNGPMSCYVVDSRGMKSDSVELSFSKWYDYSGPAVSGLTLARNGNIGTSVTLSCTAQIDQVIAEKGSAELLYSFAEVGGELGTEYSLGSLTAEKTAVQKTLAQTFAIDKNYQVKIRIADSFGETSYSTILQTAKPELSIRKGRVGINCIPIENGGALQIDGNSIFDMIYPVGSIYMSVNPTSPGTLFGGTWTRIQDRFLLAAGSSYAAGATGGEATHKLTVSEIPSHNHCERFCWENTAAAKNTLAVNGTALYATNSVSGVAGIDRGTSFGNYTGGGSAHNNMPPYLAVYMWKRTA